MTTTSTTFALIKAIDGQEMKPIVMENDTAKPDVDVLDSSLQMVRDSSAYVGVISRKYGQVPECSFRNPDALSLTELEFNEAQRLNRPVLLFIMGDKHPVTEDDIEFDAQKRKKLKAFRERAKQMQSGSSIHRVYATFNSLEEFDKSGIQAIAGLHRYLDEQVKADENAQPVTLPTYSSEFASLPQPPALRAEPPYIGSHVFLGRQAELNTLSDWAGPADTHSVLLFDAIGGTGKSMLTWEWTNKYASMARPEWAGRFWYSFYEQGAVMEDFCQRALAYMTGQSLDILRKKKTTELAPLLLAQLNARPWLLVLDGLERVLVAYHRSDAAQLADEEAGDSDQLANRDTCAAIRPEDDDLLRLLVSASPSKLLLTTRLVPRSLLNQTGQTIPGVRRVSLLGLRPLDAENLFNACGVIGHSVRIQEFLQRECDCHPLTIGALAGLIVQDYLPDRGNFDAWADDPDGAGKLNLAKLDLTQKRNHILRAAVAAAPEMSRQLLSTLSLIFEAVDYKLLSALNPHMPPKPKAMEEPHKPMTRKDWHFLPKKKKDEYQAQYKEQLQLYAVHQKSYQPAYKQWLEAEPHGLQELSKTVQDLESRGLLQYDRQARRYDLHPVVRGVVAGDLHLDAKNSLGQRVIDFFSEQAHRPYEETERLEDISGSIHLVRTLLQLERYEAAASVLINGLQNALFYNLEAYAEGLVLFRPFFPKSWLHFSDQLPELVMAYLANSAAYALQNIGEEEEALEIYEMLLRLFIKQADWTNIDVALSNMFDCFIVQNQLAKAVYCLQLVIEMAEYLEPRYAFKTLLRNLIFLSVTVQASDAEAVWQRLNSMGRNWARRDYLPGDVERTYATLQFKQGILKDENLVQVEDLVKAGRNRSGIRQLHSLRGEKQLSSEQWGEAAASFHEAVRMAHETGKADVNAEANYALANFYSNQPVDVRSEIERLAQVKKPPHYPLAKLLQSIGESKQAAKHALAAYEEAWADGEPYVLRYELNQARALLQELGVAVPNLPPYDPAQDERFPWEDEVRAAIEQLKVEKVVKKGHNVQR